MDKLINEYAENYLNKLEIGYHLSGEIKLDEFWDKLQNVRKQKANTLPLKDQTIRQFWYVMTNTIQKKLHEIDSYGRDSLYSMVKAEIESELIKESLIEEAFFSSVIEGAFSTLKKAKALAEKKESPQDKSEQMILNNFYAMRFILENRERPFSNELILELHKIVCDKTMADQQHAGKYRDDMVYITDSIGKVIYTPPSVENITSHMQDLISWINSEDVQHFVHPIIKASVLHFYFVYVHPFFDGNGRTARALFYYYLIKNQYEFFKYFSISSIINNTRGKYYKSIKDVEDYDSDLTYFLSYMTEAILKAINEIKARISEHYERDYFLAKINDNKIDLNARQNKFIRKFLLFKDRTISVDKYKEIYKVVYQTARTDLLDLADKKILVMNKKGKKFIFTLNKEF